MTDIAHRVVIQALRELGLEPYDVRRVCIDAATNTMEVTRYQLAENGKVRIVNGEPLLYTTTYQMTG